MTHAKNPVCHFEMPYEDATRVAKFYSDAFGWQMNALGPDMGNYVTAATTDTDADRMVTRPGTINGGFYPRHPDWPAQVPSVVIAVENIRQAMHDVEQAGGKVLGEPMTIPGIGEYVSFTDTEGNRVSLIEPKRPE